MASTFILFKGNVFSTFLRSGPSLGNKCQSADLFIQMVATAPNLTLCVTLAAILCSIVNPLPLIPTLMPTVQLTAAPVLGGATSSTIDAEGVACLYIALAMPKLFSLTGN